MEHKIPWYGWRALSLFILVPLGCLIGFLSYVIYQYATVIPKATDIKLNVEGLQIEVQKQIDINESLQKRISDILQIMKNLEKTCEGKNTSSQKSALKTPAPSYISNQFETQLEFLDQNKKELKKINSKLQTIQEKITQ